MNTAEELIATHGLAPHPEGGFYKETYRSSGSIPESALPVGTKGARSFSTAICFLLPKGARSRLHRLKSDEMWHFHLGGALTVVQISPSGRVTKTVMGPDAKSGQVLQHVVPAGDWFGAYPGDDAPYSFVGCTVAPGFDFADFELANRKELLFRFPLAREVIELLTDE